MRLAWIAAAVLFCANQSTLVAEDRARFSTGPIHSGSMEIELDITGAKRLSIRKAIDNRIDWQEVYFIDRDGKKLPANRFRIKSKLGEVYDLKGKGIVGFTATATVEKHKSGPTLVLIDHDAPNPAAKPEPKEVEKIKGDPGRGRRVFFGSGTCASCHVVEGRGGRVGPDLSKLGERAKVGEIIESIIAPDAVLAEGFETNIVTTEDGTPHLGFVVGTEEESLTLRDSAGQPHKIDKAEVNSRKPQTFSLMPGFGEILPAQQIADLAAFLKTLR